MRALLCGLRDFEIVAVGVVGKGHDLAEEGVVDVLLAVFNHLSEAVQIVTEAWLVRYVSSRLRFP